MDCCPDCDGLLIEDTDEDNFSASETPVGYYCPGCGWEGREPVSRADDEDYDHDDDDDFQHCASCDGHDACADFGCAFQHGLGHLVKTDEI